MLDAMLAQITIAYKQELAHNDMLMLKLTELVLVELARYDYTLPDGDPLPDNYGSNNASYKDTIKLWYADGDLCYEYYYPSRGTGDATHTGKFIDADPSVQNRTFRLLYDAWRKLSCETVSRMEHVAKLVRSEIRADKAARKRDDDTRKQLQARHARPVPEPPAEPAEADTELTDDALLVRLEET